MKTQKQLPEEFTFICDENSREQLEKLGVDLGAYDVNDIEYTYYVYNNKVVDSFYNGELKPINLSNYITQEEPIQSEQKWQSKTRGGYEYHIYEEFDGKIFGRVKSHNNGWIVIQWDNDGIYSGEDYDLIPIDPHAQRKAELQAQINTLQEELNSLEK